MNWTAVNLKITCIAWIQRTNIRNFDLAMYGTRPSLVLRSVMNWTAVNLKSISYTYWVHYIQTSKSTLEHDLSAKIGNTLNWTPVNLKSISYTYWVELTDIKIYLRTRP